MDNSTLGVQATVQLQRLAKATIIKAGYVDEKIQPVSYNLFGFDDGFGLLTKQLASDFQQIVFYEYFVSPTKLIVNVIQNALSFLGTFSAVNEHLKHAFPAV